MDVVLWCFASQQDKRSGKFRLGSDSGVRLYDHIAGRLLAGGHNVVIVVPDQAQCIDRYSFQCSTIELKYEVSNLDRRLQWNPKAIRRVLDGVDLLLTQHETLAFPARCLFPDLRIITECGMAPGTAWPQTEPLHRLAWGASDAVHCNSRSLADVVGPKALVWRFGYDDSLSKPSILIRDVDVLFPARASSTHYSHHAAFMGAVDRAGWKVVMTDPTSYLRTTGQTYWVTNDPLDRSDYEVLLRRSRVVVGLTDNGYGGWAFYEAIAAGACPVALRCPEYVELLGSGWPYYAESLDPLDIRVAIRNALEVGWDGVPVRVSGEMLANLSAASYSAAWRVASQDIRRICSPDRASGALG